MARSRVGRGRFARRMELLDVPRHSRPSLRRHRRPRSGARNLEHAQPHRLPNHHQHHRRKAPAPPNSTWGDRAYPQEEQSEKESAGIQCCAIKSDCAPEVESQTYRVSGDIARSAREPQTGISSTSSSDSALLEVATPPRISLRPNSRRAGCSCCTGTARLHHHSSHHPRPTPQADGLRIPSLRRRRCRNQPCSWRVSLPSVVDSFYAPRPSHSGRE